MPIFISYSHADKEFVDRLAIEFVKNKVHVWIDKWELNIGDSITNKIEEAITDASHLIIVLSKNSVNSNWCKREITAGLLREMEAKRVVVLPVLIDDCQIPLFLRDKLYADFSKDFDDGLNGILNSLERYTNDTLGRVQEKEEFFTDYALSWGMRGEYYEMQLDIVDFSISPKMPFSVLANIVFVGNKEVTRSFKEYLIINKDWVMKDVILMMCAEEENISKMMIHIIDNHPIKTEFNIRDQKLDYNFKAYLTVKRLGNPTGKDIVFYLGNIFKNIWNEIKSNK